MEAYSIQGNNGGNITLHAQSITIAPSHSSNQNLDNTLVLGQNQLDNTGFTQISLQSVDNTVIETGVSFSPSLVKLSTPIPGGAAVGSALTSVAPDLIGEIILFRLGRKSLVRPHLPVLLSMIPIPNTNATIRVLQGAKVNMAPGGSISLKAPTVTIGGDLNAPAGTVAITATLGDLHCKAVGAISAAGYNEPGLKPVMPGYPVSYTALPGGSVTLSAPNGSVITEAGSLVDVSGSSAVKTYLLNGSGVPTAQTVASNPGSITISAITPSLNGTLEGEAKLSGLQGGTLSITSLNPQAGYTMSNSDFSELSCRRVRCADFPQLHGADFLRPHGFYSREEPDTRCAFFYGIRERSDKVPGALT